MHDKDIDSETPWWKFGYVWLVLSGPAVVVVASVVTFYVAATRPDPVVAEDYYRKGIEINKELNSQGSNMMPAVQARNHAQTGVLSAR